MYFDSERKDGTGFSTDLIEIPRESEELEPKYNVVLLDDNDHTYEYVIEMLMKLFGHSKETSYEMACEVDFLGTVTVFNGNKNDAEEKREQIISYGPDWRLERSTGSMNARIEITE